MRVRGENVGASKKKSAQAISKKIESLEDPWYMQPFGRKKRTPPPPIGGPRTPIYGGCGGGALATPHEGIPWGVNSDPSYRNR